MAGGGDGLVPASERLKSGFSPSRKWFEEGMKTYALAVTVITNAEDVRREMMVPSARHG